MGNLKRTCGKIGKIYMKKSNISKDLNKNKSERINKTDITNSKYRLNKALMMTMNYVINDLFNPLVIRPTHFG